MPSHPSRGRLEQMASADTGWEVFLRLTQVSGTAHAGVPCQLRCIEDRCLSVRSSLTPRSVSSGPQAVVILILFFFFFFCPAGTEIKKGEIKNETGDAIVNPGIACRCRVTDADCRQYIDTKYIISFLFHRRAQTHLSTHMQNKSCLNSCFPRRRRRRGEKCRAGSRCLLIWILQLCLCKTVLSMIAHGSTRL